MDGKDKYSLWLVPSGEAGKTLQSLADTLSKRYNAPVFVPHLTLVGNIFANDSDLHEVTQKIEELAKSISTFTINLTAFDFKDEPFRCLYLLAEPLELERLYVAAETAFPQVSEEHFQAMPHLSVLYGNYPSSVKEQIITDNPIAPIECSINSLELYLTNDPTDSWRLTQSFPLTKR